MDRKTVSINQASELVGVGRRTIYNWMSAGKLEYVRTAGGSVRIYADTLWRSHSLHGKSSADSSTSTPVEEQPSPNTT